MIDHIPSPRPQHQNRHLFHSFNSMKPPMNSLIDIIQSHNLVPPTWTVAIIEVHLNHVMKLVLIYGEDLDVSITWIPWTLVLRALMKWEVLAGETSPRSSLLFWALGGAGVTFQVLSSRARDSRNLGRVLWRMLLDFRWTLFQINYKVRKIKNDGNCLLKNILGLKLAQ